MATRASRRSMKGDRKLHTNINYLWFANLSVYSACGGVDVTLGHNTPPKHILSTSPSLIPEVFLFLFLWRFLLKVCLLVFLFLFLFCFVLFLFCFPFFCFVFPYKFVPLIFPHFSQSLRQGTELIYLWHFCTMLCDCNWEKSSLLNTVKINLLLFWILP